jgi:hypothetical protein
MALAKYLVVSGRLVGFEQGSTVTDLDLLAAGVNVVSLLAAGHIQPSTTSTRKGAKKEQDQPEEES